MPENAEGLMKQDKIIIIGGGPCGLTALRTLLTTPQVKSGAWTATIFEASSALGGVWRLPPAPPIYASLTTNLPHPLMSFPDFPFPPSTPLFPKASVVGEYINAYADHFNLRQHVRLNSTVVHADWDGSQWVVRVRVRERPDEEETHSCSLLLVCNGHHNVPRIPTTPGLSTWLSPPHGHGHPRASHSQTYRDPTSLRLPPHLSLSESTLLIIGTGPSGLDISAELAPLCHRLFLSSSSLPKEDAPQGCIPKPPVSYFSIDSSCKVRFTDGSEEHVDYCILATGYELSFPFFSSSPSPPSPSTASSQPTPPTPHFTLAQSPIPSTHLSPNSNFNTPLTNTSSVIYPLARHLFGIPGCGFSSTPPHENGPTTLPPATSLAFLGLLVRVAPLPVAEAQARAVVAVFQSSRLVQSNPSTDGGGGGSQRDTTTSAGINWQREIDLIRNRLALLSSQFLSNSSDQSRSLSTTSLSTSLSPSPSPPPSQNSTQIESETQSHSQKLLILTHLSKKYHHITTSPASSDQFAYRDALDDLCFSSLSSLSSRTRVKPYERPLYALKNDLRAGWSAIERRGPGVVSDWVGGVGEGRYKGEGGGGGEEEWVGLMWRVLDFWEREGEGGRTRNGMGLKIPFERTPEREH